MRVFWEALRDEIAKQADRAFVWLVVAFAAGITLFFAWARDPSFLFTLGVVAAGAALYPFRIRVYGAAFVALALVAFGLGHGLAQWRTARVATPLLEREMRPFMLTATVQEADKRPDGNRLVLADFVIPGIAPAATPDRLRITVPASHGVPAVGDRIRVRAVARPAALPVLPDGFQFQRFLYFSGIGGVGYSLGRWETVSAPKEPSIGGRLHIWTEGLRRRIGDRINEIIPGDDGPVAAALVNGEQSAIPEDLQESYRISGIAHLLSISGVHMSLLAGVVFFVVRRLLALVPAIALRTDTKKWAAGVALAATAFYVLISGLSVPAVRSFIMLGVVMLAILLDRTALSLRTIAWAALILMAIYPEAVFGASFQMSFLAVLALVALYEQSWLRLKWRNSDGQLMVLRVVGLYLAGLVVTDIIAGGATSLFAAYHFNRLPTYSAITNLAAVPLTGLWIMPSAILALVLMPFGADGIALRVMGEGVGLLNDLARTIAHWPGAQFHVPPMATPIMALAALGIVFVSIWRGPRRWLGFALVLPAMMQPFLSAPPDLLIDQTGSVFAVTDSSGRLVNRPGRSGRFVRDAWTERYGKSPETWPGEGELGLTCDADGCVISRAEHKTLLALKDNALAEDCGEADVTISVGASRDLCRQGKIVDVFDLRRDGAIAVWMTAKGVRLRSVREGTGDRIWMRGESADAEGVATEVTP